MSLPDLDDGRLWSEPEIAAELHRPIRPRGARDDIRPPGMPCRDRKFESIPLQQRVQCEPRCFGISKRRDQEALDAHAKGPMPGNTYKDWIVGRKVARGAPAN
jgi:hypothetical protein